MTARFDQLPLAPSQLANLGQLGYLAMTPVQAAALPLALAGHDLIVQARTGSGKTAAFALALIARLETRRFDVQALVLCPTRELADQVTQEIRRLARAEENIKVLTLCGGTPIRPQAESLEHGAHVVVGTPGRILDHLERGTLSLASLNTLVLDEADRMLDMGFFDDIAAVAKLCPPKRQTLLFSATYPDGITQLSARFLRQPKEVKLTETHAAGQIRQRFYEVTETERLHAVGLLLRVAEGEGAHRAVVVQQQAHGVQPFGLGHLVEALADLAGGVGLGEPDLLRLAQEPRAQLGNAVGVGGREQQGLALGRAQLGHCGDVVEEPHVEHAVGFVQHQGVERRERQRAALQVVEDAAGRAHHHVGAVFEALGLRADGRAAAPVSYTHLTLPTILLV